MATVVFRRSAPPMNSFSLAASANVVYGLNLNTNISQHVYVNATNSANFNASSSIIPSGGSTINGSDGKTLTNHRIYVMDALNGMLDTTVEYTPTAISYSYRTLLTELGFIPGGVSNHFSVKFKGMSRYNFQDAAQATELWVLTAWTEGIGDYSQIISSDFSTISTKATDQVFLKAAETNETITPWETLDYPPSGYFSFAMAVSLTVGSTLTIYNPTGMAIDVNLLYSRTNLERV